MPANKSSDVPTSSGYVSLRIKEEPPIFSKQKMKINLPKDILHLTVCNNWLVTLMAHHVLLRMFLLQPDRQDGRYISVSKYCFETTILI